MTLKQTEAAEDLAALIHQQNVEKPVEHAITSILKPWARVLHNLDRQKDAERILFACQTLPEIARGKRVPEFEEAISVAGGPILAVLEPYLKKIRYQAGLRAAEAAAQAERDERSKKALMQGFDALLGIGTDATLDDVSAALERHGHRALAEQVPTAAWYILRRYREITAEAREMSSKFASVLGCNNDVAEIGAALAEAREELLRGEGADHYSRYSDSRRAGIGLLAAMFWGSRPWRDHDFSEAIKGLGYLSYRRHERLHRDPASSASQTA